MSLTKNEYFQLRENNSIVELLYYYFTEKGGISSPDYFPTELSQWVKNLQKETLKSTGNMVSGDRIINTLKQHAIRYYDEKFEVIEIHYSKEIKEKRKIILVT